MALVLAEFLKTPVETWVTFGMIVVGVCLVVLVACVGSEDEL